MRQARAAAALVTAAAIAATGAPAETQISRSPLGEAIRAALVATPDLLSGLIAPPRPPLDLYGEAIARDFALLTRLAPRLFDPARPALGPAGAPTRIALFTRADCPDCRKAKAGLQALAARMGFRAVLFDMTRDAALAHDLGLDTAPSYVMADRILRGAMPSIVLERYLNE